MGIFDMFSGRKQRLALIEAERRQTLLQFQQILQEQKLAKEAKKQFQIEQRQQEELIQQSRSENKARLLETSIASLGGMTGFRSLLSGRKGGGGFGPRSMLDAA